MFIYVSFKDEDLEQAKSLAYSMVKNGMFPFLPRLSKLVDQSNSITNWIEYYKAWLHKCDCLYATASAREHELQYAKENGIPIVRTWQELLSVKLPQYGEIARQFGRFATEELEDNEVWRHKELNEVVKECEELTGKLPVALGKFRCVKQLQLVTTRIVRAWDMLGGFRV